MPFASEAPKQGFHGAGFDTEELGEPAHRPRRPPPHLEPFTDTPARGFRQPPEPGSALCPQPPSPGCEFALLVRPDLT